MFGREEVDREAQTEMNVHALDGNWKEQYTHATKAAS